MNISRINFEWHDEKATSNLKKHGISFEEAMTVFGDEFALVNLDNKHSEIEKRWLIIGTASIGYYFDSFFHNARPQNSHNFRQESK
ncbi:MAG: BrnT family toxin [Candidatus Kapaibacteriota bacterium]|jgi:uncharacterized DUF497 family protein